MPSASDSSDARPPAATVEPSPDGPGSAAWWQERVDRTTRRRPRTDGLSTERIIDAAIRLVDEEGLTALTVRRLAERLGTGSASLYRHVASREELVVLMVDQVIGEVVLPDDQLSWRERVEQLARELRRVLLDHERLLPALTAAPLLGPNALRGVDVGLQSAIDAGFAPEVAAPAVLALIDFVLGTVYFDTSSAGRSFAAGHDTGVRQRVVPLAPTPVGDEVFSFGLETFLSGLETRFATDRTAP